MKQKTISQKLIFFLNRISKNIENILSIAKINNKRTLLVNNYKSSYIEETIQFSKNTKKLTLKDFWEFYVSGSEAPHYKIPYKGRLMTKLPCDMFIYPDIIYQLKPEIIVEIGTQRGISAIYFADLIKNNRGKVLTIDINSPDDKILNEFKDNNITFINGNINDSLTIKQITDFCKGRKCLVIDDGSHNQDDVYFAFKSLNHLIPNKGLYIIEDGMTNIIIEPKNKDFQPNIGINRILKDYTNFKQFRNYDIFIFSTIFKGIIQKIE